MSIIAFVPARSGSKRVPRKNTRDLCGHPLLAYTVQAAKDSGIFSRIIVSSDSQDTLDLTMQYGADGLFCPLTIAHNDMDPDIKWINHALQHFTADHFAILRPTSPFRTGETIRRAYDQYDGSSWMKAVEPVRQHPGKMWQAGISRMGPYMGFGSLSHALPTQMLETLYVQNGSLEIRPFSNPEPEMYQPFFTHGYEGFDINIPVDFMLAELVIKWGLATLPEIRV